jgi:hypothetical protein
MSIQINFLFLIILQELKTAACPAFILLHPPLNPHRYTHKHTHIQTDVVRDLPPEDVLAHGLYLWGFSFSSSSSAIEREALTSPWTAVGALITWLPPHDTCAVAMFYSIPTANRALRQVQAPAGVTAQSLKRASSEVQQQALAGKKNGKKRKRKT